MEYILPLEFSIPFSVPRMVPPLKKPTSLQPLALIPRGVSYSSNNIFRSKSDTNTNATASSMLRERLWRDHLIESTPSLDILHIHSAQYRNLQI